MSNTTETKSEYTLLCNVVDQLHEWGHRDASDDLERNLYLFTDEVLPLFACHVTGGGPRRGRHHIGFGHTIDSAREDAHSPGWPEADTTIYRLPFGAINPSFDPVLGICWQYAPGHAPAEGESPRVTPITSPAGGDQ